MQGDCTISTYFVHSVHSLNLNFNYILTFRSNAAVSPFFLTCGQRPAARDDQLNNIPFEW